jgi:hypothetical protein
MIRASSVIALLLTLCHTAWCFSALSGPIILFILNRRDGDATKRLVHLSHKERKQQQ